MDFAKVADWVLSLIAMMLAYVSLHSGSYALGLMQAFCGGVFLSKVLNDDY